MNGVISTSPALLLRLADYIEGCFPDTEECVDVGGGVHETRAEYKQKFKRCDVRHHPDGTQAALVMPAEAKAKLDVLKIQIQAKRATSTASLEEIAIDDLPAEAPLDEASWSPTPPPIPDG